MTLRILQFEIFIFLALSYYLCTNGAKILYSSGNVSVYESTKVENLSESCARITDELGYPFNFTTDLYPGGNISENDYAELRYRLTYCFYTVGENYTIPCRMEICGYSQNISTNISQGNCDQYGSSYSTKFPYKRGYTATSLRCGCSQWGTNDCTKDTCPIQEASHTWQKHSSDCALMYEEPNCQVCYFTPTVLTTSSRYNTSNSHEIKSMIVKSGCSVERSTHGYMDQDNIYEDITTFTGIVTYISPSFHIRSASFSCECSSDEKLIEIIFLFVGLGIILSMVVLYSLHKAYKNYKMRPSNTKNISPNSQDEQSIPPNHNGNYAADNLLATNENLFRMEARIERFLNMVFGQPSSSPLDQQGSLLNDMEYLHILENQLYKISDKSRIFSSNAFCIDLQNFLGAGHFSTVHTGLLRVNGIEEPVAVKKLKRDGGRENWLFKSFLQEVRIFEMVGNGSDFIVKYFGACCDTDGLYLLTEYCEHGSLKSFMMETIRPKYEGKPMGIENMRDLGDNYYTEWEEVEIGIKKLDSSDYLQLLVWCENVTNGMDYLHNKQIIHGDLAVRNVLLSKDLTAKICDFGLSRKCTNKEYFVASLIKGKFPFNSLAPECINDDEPGLQQNPLSIDVWAFGCTLWEMFTLGDTLYADVEGHGMLKFMGVVKRLQNGVPYTKPPLASDMIHEQMLTCWNRIPDNRPSFAKLRIKFDIQISELFQI